jgi:SAM-dependent methyltransferase
VTYESVSEYAFPIDDDCYDIVLSGQVVEHVPRIWRWMREVSRVCKEGGVVITIKPRELAIPRSSTRLLARVPGGHEGALRGLVAGRVALALGIARDSRLHALHPWTPPDAPAQALARRFPSARARPISGRASGTTRSRSGGKFGPVKPFRVVVPPVAQRPRTASATFFTSARSFGRNHAA